MLLSDPAEGGLNYTQYFHLAWLFVPTIRRVLFVGLGGGTGPKMFLKYYPRVQVDVAEIDPEIVEVARAHFALPDDERLRVLIGDGRTIIEDAPSQTYDVIYVDAYTTTPSGRALIPPQLCTVEFFQVARRALTPQGCLCDNLIGTLDFVHQRPVRAILRTIQAIFPTCLAFDVYGSFNTIFYALTSHQEWNVPSLQRALQRWRPQHEAVRERLEPLVETLISPLPSLADVPILRDAENPLPKLMEEVF
jgi:spermidine synthase